MPPKSSGTPLLQAWQVPYVVHTQNVLTFRVLQPPHLIIQPLSAPNRLQVPDHRPRVLRTPRPSVRSMVARHP